MHTLVINIADVPLILRFDDNKLCHSVAPCLQSVLSRSNRTAESSIEVSLKHNAIRPPSEGKVLKLNGYGEYSGWFNPDKQIGSVYINKKRPSVTLANCLRQIYRILIEINGGIVLHAAGIVHANTTLVFAGKSGAGKSTIASLAENAAVLSDDLIAVRKSGTSFYAWGLPGTLQKTVMTCTDNNGDIKHSTRKIAAIFLLQQDSHNRLIRLNNASAASRLFAFSGMSPTINKTTKTLESLGALTHYVPCYNFHFVNRTSAWHYIETKLARFTDRHIAGRH
ncbi:MAG: hypothetical protein JXN60_06860 [Lentisphaerae bacterium]|nr:hypothetical protein [Lentisphaerota bacterium]